ncbi:conserved exported hypothetical protein [Cupriavidus necator]|uniref:Outer membrane lipoprotein n=1 Tax=Cupriavidus necator TaxID=106590 RepID=A0A1K0IE41_CUPNE|nr:conserved exported hypothetical protein [Cupriavidus necator]
MNATNHGACLLALLLSVACAPLPIVKRAPVPPPEAKGEAVAAAPKERATPIANKTINIAAACKRTEEDGFREDALMDVKGNEVRALKWKLWVSRRGSCEFNLAQFRQVRETPHIELQAIDGSQCKLLVWQDPRRVTLAHNRCEKHCTPGIYEQAWPVLFDPKSGACAEVR